jgi:hypothetical protein
LWDVIWLSDIPWAGLWQRPQQLATRFPEDARILFVEPWTLGHEAALRPAPVADRIQRVSFPFLPLHARSLRMRRLAYRLGDSGAATASLAALQQAWIGTLGRFFRPGSKRLTLVENFMAYPTLRSWRPDRVVYDMIDAPLHFAPVPPRLVPAWESLLREADRVIVTSGPLESLARHGGSQHVARVGNGVEARRFADASPSILPGRGSAGFGYGIAPRMAGFVAASRAAFRRPASSWLVPRTRTRGTPSPEAATPNPLDGSAPLPRDPGDAPRPRGPDSIRRTPSPEVNPVKLTSTRPRGVVTTRQRRGGRAAPRPVVTARTDSSTRPGRASRSSPALRAFAAEHDWDTIARRFIEVVLEDAA